MDSEEVAKGVLGLFALIWLTLVTVLAIALSGALVYSTWVWALSLEAC